MKNAILAVCILSVVTEAPALSAQSLPRFSAELSAGRGARTTQAGAVWYAGDHEDYLRAGLTMRIGSPGRVRPVLSADYSAGVRGDQVLVCGLAHWRRLDWQRADGSDLWFQPLSVGIRVQ